MSYAKRLLALSVPCLLSGLCFLVLSAATAQASGNWRIQGSAGLAVGSSVIWEADAGSYAFLLPTLNLQLVFQKSTFTGGKLHSEGKGTAEFKFSEGKVYTIEGLEELPCIVGDLTFNSATNLFLHKEKTYNSLTVNTITTYASGTGCPLAPKNTVAGTVVLEGNFEEEAVKHLFKVAPASLFPELTIKFGTNPLIVDGSWIGRLVGVHEGLSWSGIG